MTRVHVLQSCVCVRGEPWGQHQWCLPPLKTEPSDPDDSITVLQTVHFMAVRYEPMAATAYFTCHVTQGPKKHEECELQAYLAKNIVCVAKPIISIGRVGLPEYTVVLCFQNLGSEFSVFSRLDQLHVMQLSETSLRPSVIRSAGGTMSRSYYCGAPVSSHDTRPGLPEYTVVLCFQNLGSEFSVFSRLDQLHVMQLSETSLRPSVIRSAGGTMSRSYYCGAPVSSHESPMHIGPYDADQVRKAQHVPLPNVAPEAS